jgi:pyruvate/2-oxoglutarate dehydrogenase complex dihydrolipoamide acyltransferase (E2) component
MRAGRGSSGNHSAVTEVRLQAAGVVERLVVEVGQNVAAGAPLALLDSGAAVACPRAGRVEWLATAGEALEALGVVARIS